MRLSIPCVVAGLLLVPGCSSSERHGQSDNSGSGGGTSTGGQSSPGQGGAGAGTTMMGGTGGSGPIATGGTGGFVSPPGPPTVAVSGDRWSDPKTWGGKLPVKGDKVVIPAGRTILVDIDPPALAGLTVNGTLVFDDRDVVLTSDFIAVMGGRFQLGEPSKPFTKRATITLTGNNPDGTPETTGFGGKVFAVMDGILDIHGAPVQRSWTKLNAEVAAGATQIELAEAPGWKTGDRIFVTTSSPQMNDYDLVEVDSVSGTTVKLKQALKYAHYGKTRSVGATPIDVRAEVGLLTRNIVVQGDADSEANKLGGHMMFMADKAITVRLSDIEVTRAGQYNRLGRYPIHFHLIRNHCVDCQVHDVSVHDTVQRGIVVHDTALVTVANNVVFNTLGHNYIVETETTAGNLFKGNLAAVNRMPNPAFTTVALKAQNDDIPSGFWIKNLNNTWIDNAVGGSVGMGFFFDDAKDGPVIMQRNTVHAAMALGANRDFNMQSGVLVKCAQEQPASAKITDLLVYQNGNLSEKDPAGFWPETCTTYHKGFTPFEIARIQAIDNARNVELRHQSDVYTMSDVIFTGSLLSAKDTGPAIFAQYGGTANLIRPVFANYKSAGLFASNDILGLWIARFRISEAKLIDVNPMSIHPESLTETLDDSFMPKGAYVVPDGNKPTLLAKDCTALTGGDYGIYRCPKLYTMGFLVVRQGDHSDAEGEMLSGGTPLHTLMPITRSDGAKFMPTSYGFGGYELIYGSGMTYKLDAQPQGTITAQLSPMGSLTTGADEAAMVEVSFPLAAAPKSVSRTNDAGGVAAMPKATDKMSAGSGTDLASYKYDAGAKLLTVQVNSRWVIIEP